MSLYVVATPLGNLADISARALETLRAARVIICEDTRHTRKLLSHFDVHAKLLSLHAHTTAAGISSLVKKLASGEDTAMVSDAGTPGISDPGSALVAAAAEAGIAVIPIPGPSAVAAAVSVCGFPADRFLFLGFVPHKKGRAAFITALGGSPYTTVFFESPHRIARLLEELRVALQADRKLFIARELTKLHEHLYRTTVGKAPEALDAERGEFTLVLAPQKL